MPSSEHEYGISRRVTEINFFFVRSIIITSYVAVPESRPATPPSPTPAGTEAEPIEISDDEGEEESTSLRIPKVSFE